MTYNQREALLFMNLRPYQQTALSAISEHNKGIVVIPTGGGKTTIFLQDVKTRLESATGLLNIVVVAPKILLASQLASQFKSYLKDFDNIFITDVHSGENGITNPSAILTTNRMIRSMNLHHILFTTYKSLPRILEAGIEIDVAIFDEAHHSTIESNFVGVAQTSMMSKNTYFFTATPKHTKTKTSMCNSSVYGGTIVSVPANQLVKDGYILPPKVMTYKSESFRTKDNACFVDAENVLNFLNEIEIDNPKVLVASPSTKVIADMLSQTDLIQQLEDMDYQILHITSKYGPIVNGKKVSRELFFETLSQLGNDDTAKFVLFHYSIISEGIDVPGFNAALLLRNLPFIELVQTIGRILRMNKEDYQDIQNGVITAGDFDKYRKSCGIVSVPVSNNYGDAIAQRLQQVVDAIFVEGKILIV
jgi:superfamily II DNA or RNA helicase